MLGCPMLFYFLMRKRGEAEMQAHAQYYSDCLDSVQGMSTLKAFNANGRQKEAIYQKGERLRQAVMGQLRVTMLENVVLQFFAGLGNAFAIAIAAYQCAGGHMEPGRAGLRPVSHRRMLRAHVQPHQRLGTWVIAAWWLPIPSSSCRTSPCACRFCPKRAPPPKRPPPLMCALKTSPSPTTPADGDVLHGVSFDVPGTHHDRPRRRFRQRQIHHCPAPGGLLSRAGGQRMRGRTNAQRADRGRHTGSDRRPSGRTVTCFTAPWRTISAWASLMPRARRSSRPRRKPASTISFPACLTATRPCSASAACAFPAASGSAWRWRGRFCATRPSSS